MQQDCFEKLNLWADRLQESYNKNLLRNTKYDVHYSIALVNLNSLAQIELNNWVRTSDEVVVLDDSHWIVFYQYTTIDEAHYAVKNLHTRLKESDHYSLIVCTDMRPNDTSVYKILQRLCFLSFHITKQDEEFLAKSRLEEDMNIFDIDFSDL